MPRDAGFLYAIQAEGPGYVKIGSTTGTVAEHLRNLTTGHHAPLSLLASVPISSALAAVERHMHHLLADSWHHGEWFNVALTREEFLRLAAEAWELAQREPHPPRFFARARMGRPRFGADRLQKYTLMLDPAMLAEIDARVARLHAQVPMVKVDRSALCRSLLAKGLAVDDSTSVAYWTPPWRDPDAASAFPPPRRPTRTRKEADHAA